MCMVCSGYIPHPSLAEIPIWYSLIQVMGLLVVGYWFAFKMKVANFFSGILNKQTKPPSSKKELL